MAAGNPPPLLDAAAVRRVLSGYAEGRVGREDAQAWASFVRHGYFAGPAAGQPIDIEYAAAAEMPIVDAVGRLDELGDDIDGEIDADESASLLADLGGA